MKCSALNVNFNGDICLSFDPLGSTSRVDQIWVPRSKRAISATVD